MSAAKRRAPAQTVLPNGHFIGPDGREYVSIKLATHRAFATACVEEWHAAEGVSRHSFLRFAKAITVPVAVLEGARKRLAKEEIPQEFQQ